MKRLWMILVILSACLAATSASAKNSHAYKHDKDRDDVKRHDRDDVKRHDRDDDDDRKGHAKRGDHDYDDRDGDRNRDRHKHKFHARKHHDNDDEREVFIPRHDRRPPGWDHGRKVGWGGCDVPPGQAKKMGCDRDDSRYAHRAPEHRIEAHTKPVIVRRPIVRRPTARVTAEGRATATVN